MPVSTDSKDKLKEALQRTDEIEITVIGRKSGRPVTNIVWFALEGDTLYLLPVKGSESQWFKNVLKNSSIKISAGGVQGEFTANPTTDPKIVSSVVEKFRAKYGAGEVKKYYTNFDAAVVVKLS
jgi:deazaflavin-dependent oxidoreductase (nitroreductase family)